MMNEGSRPAGRGCRCEPEDAHSQDARVCVCVCSSRGMSSGKYWGEIDKKLLFFHTREARRCEERGEAVREI